ncbi:GIY-YIG nuclease family protein [Halomarina pelagica]|uniref:GIY-YIG nuclease family protein n=1 Tax=Halomarina pelagica TaxID=2961599 RepID=UPI0020C1FCBA|nr:GIY-YIG nuclease family protein [Halomarina sp. BND7]
MNGAGTYTLLVRLPTAARVAFGAAGERALSAGWYAYTGSALGPGGFSRVDRHRELARGERDGRHWHVDYLLGHPAASIEAAVTTDGEDRECAVARALADGDTAAPVPGLGASDCDCDTHLVFAPERAPLERSVRAAHRSARA